MGTWHPCSEAGRGAGKGAVAGREQQPGALRMECPQRGLRVPQPHGSPAHCTRSHSPAVAVGHRDALAPRLQLWGTGAWGERAVLAAPRQTPQAGGGGDIPAMLLASPPRGWRSLRSM